MTFKLLQQLIILNIQTRLATDAPLSLAAVNRNEVYSV